MLNHVRTLLLNETGGTQIAPGEPGEEYVPGSFRKRQLADAALRLHRLLFGTKPQRIFQNLRLRQLLAIVHNSDLAELAENQDSRITYLPFATDNFLHAEYQPRVVQHLGDTQALQIFGRLPPDMGAGRITADYGIQLRRHTSIGSTTYAIDQLADGSFTDPAFADWSQFTGEPEGSSASSADSGGASAGAGNSVPPDWLSGGDGAAQLPIDGAALYQSITLITGRVYRVSFLATPGSGTGAVYGGPTVGSAAWFYFEFSGAQVERSFEFTAPGSSGFLHVSSDLQNSSSIVYFYVALQRKTVVLTLSTLDITVTRYTPPQLQSATTLDGATLGTLLPPAYFPGSEVYFRTAVPTADADWTVTLTAQPIDDLGTLLAAAMNSDVEELLLPRDDRSRLLASVFHDHPDYLHRVAALLLALADAIDRSPTEN